MYLTVLTLHEIIFNCNYNIDTRYKYSKVNLLT